MSPDVLHSDSEDEQESDCEGETLHLNSATVDQQT